MFSERKLLEQLDTPRKQIAAAVFFVLLAVFIVVRGLTSAHQLSIRAPEPIGEAPDVGVLQPSVFSLPVRVALEPLVEIVEEALPRRFGDLEDRFDIPGNDRLDAAFEVERSRISAQFEDSLAILRTTLSYRARAWYDPPVLPEVSASCGTGEGALAPRLSVSLVTPLAFGADWGLRSQIREYAIIPTSTTDRDRCRVTALNLDMTSRVVEAARDVVRDMGPDADAALAELDLRPQFQEWWDQIAQPVRLADDVWLLLTPEAVGAGPVRGAGEDLVTSLSLRARPRIVLSPHEPDVGATPLPGLASIELGDDGIRILAEAQASYAEVTVRLEEEFVGRDLQAGNRTLRVEAVRFSGVGDGRLAIALDVAGDAEGTVYLVGRPVYDPIADQITVPDLDFDVETKDALTSGAAWIARLGLVDDLREHARWPAASAIEWARDQVEAGFNSRLSEQVRLSGSVDTVSVFGVVADSAWLRVRAEVRGRATLIVEER